MAGQDNGAAAPGGAAGPLADPVEEARRLVAAATDGRLMVRVLGGVAVRLQSPSAGSLLPRQFGDIDIATLSRQEGVNASLMSRIVRLAFLSPQIVETILAGEQPAHLDAAKLITIQLPCDWQDQAAALSIQ